MVATTTTRAMRRANKRRAEGPLNRAEQRALDAISSARIAGIVLDDDRDVQMPAVHGKIAMSVEASADMGGASLRWNLSESELDKMLAEASHALDFEPVEKRRALARETVISILLRGDHVHDVAVANTLGALVTWLIFSSDSAPVLRQRKATNAGYLISQTGPDEWNFRLVAGS
jgi:hypothetical protein